MRFKRICWRILFCDWKLHGKMSVHLCIFLHPHGSHATFLSIQWVVVQQILRSPSSPSLQISVVLDSCDNMVLCPWVLVLIIWRINADLNELADSRTAASSAPVAVSNDPTIASQSTSEFDFNEFFHIDSVSNSIMILHFSAWTLFVERQNEHLAYQKNWVLVCWWWLFDWSFAHIISAVVTTTSITLSSNKSRMETFWYRLTQIHLEKWPREREREWVTESKFKLLRFFIEICWGLLPTPGSVQTSPSFISSCILYEMVQLGSSCVWFSVLYKSWWLYCRFHQY